jgi:hypothetical protein
MHTIHYYPSSEPPLLQLALSDFLSSQSPWKKSEPNRIMEKASRVKLQVRMLAQM